MARPQTNDNGNRRFDLGGWMALMRISNLPTVWSDALAGLAVGYVGAFAVAGGAPLPLWQAVLSWPFFCIAAAASCFYLAGMVLNDVADLAHDAAERASRPIVAGRVSYGSALSAGVALLAAGLALLWASGSPAAGAFGAALASAVVLYDLWHKALPGAVLLMGASRALVVLMAASLFPTGPGWPWAVWPVAGALGVYTVLLTVIARREDYGVVGARQWLSMAMAPLALTPAIFIRPVAIHGLFTLIAAGLMVIWLTYAAWLVTRQPPRTMHAVMAWIAGMSLFDAYVLCLTGHPWLAVAAAGCFVLTRLLQQRVLGT